MTFTIIILLIILFFPLFLYPILKDIGHTGWKSGIPFYNYWLWIKMVKKPWWWFVIMFVPYINVFMIFLLIVETAKCYQKYKLKEQALAVLFPYVYLPYLGINKEQQFLDPAQRPEIKKSATRDWADALIFAIVAATIIRTFMFEAYTIPTSSMEKSLLVGDFLFVSKMRYGPKIPNTPIAFPFVHHSLPVTSTKSYLEWIKLPYYRFPGIAKVENNDELVFNYPSGDTVVLERQAEDYYRIVRDAESYMKQLQKESYIPGMGRSMVWDRYHVVDRPVDKRENYIKRCVGIAGDTLELIEQQLYINGEKATNPTELQTSYFVQTKQYPVSDRALRKLGVSQEDINFYKQTRHIHLTEAMATQLAKNPSVEILKKNIAQPGIREPHIFPQSELFDWNIDNIGPIYIPKAGSTVPLTPENIALYRKAIETYENNTFEERPDGIYINGEKRDSYTFKMNYYWLMGDNRHNSADSRYWGFVPENHVVGKASMIWLSLDKDKSLFDGKIRWNRLFTFL